MTWDEWLVIGLAILVLPIIFGVFAYAFWATDPERLREEYLKSPMLDRIKYRDIE